MEKTDISNVELKGYIPGAIGRITQLHGTYYSQHWGLNLNFETEIAIELSEFLLRFNPTRDGFWTVLLRENIVGAIAIDGSQASNEGARLRWLIVSPDCQGCGLGRLMISQALDFCKNSGFSRVYLWTFAGLRTARHLYEQFGFNLDEEYLDSCWGNPVTRQKFQLNLT